MRCRKGKTIFLDVEVGVVGLHCTTITYNQIEFLLVAEKRQPRPPWPKKVLHYSIKTVWFVSPVSLHCHEYTFCTSRCQRATCLTISIQHSSSHSYTLQLKLTTTDSVKNKLRNIFGLSFHPKTWNPWLHLCLRTIDDLWLHTYILHLKMLSSTSVNFSHFSIFSIDYLHWIITFIWWDWKVLLKSYHVVVRPFFKSRQHQLPM